MKSWKSAGLWLAVFACVGGVGWALGEREGMPSHAPQGTRHDAKAEPTAGGNPARSAG